MATTKEELLEAIRKTNRTHHAAGLAEATDVIDKRIEFWSKQEMSSTRRAVLDELHIINVVLANEIANTIADAVKRTL